MHWVKLALADEPVGTEGGPLCYVVYGGAPPAALLRKVCFPGSFAPRRFSM